MSEFITNSSTPAKKSILKESVRSKTSQIDQKPPRQLSSLDSCCYDDANVEQTTKLLIDANNELEPKTDSNSKQHNEHPDYLCGGNSQTRTDEESKSDSGCQNSHRPPFGSKKFQQVWFALKRFSPIHKPSSATVKEDPRRHRKFSVGYENDHFVVEPIISTGSPSPKVFWSPFTRRRAANSDHNNNSHSTKNSKRFRLYSSHPDISSTHLNNADQFLEESVNAKLQYDDDFEQNHGSSNFGARWNQFTGSRSPLNKFRKIKRDMRRCVQRASSSDYDLNVANVDEIAADPADETKPIDYSQPVTIPQPADSVDDNGSLPRKSNKSTPANQSLKRNILDSFSDIKKPKLFIRSKTPTLDSQSSVQSQNIPTEEEMVLRVEYNETDGSANTSTPPPTGKRTSTEIALENAQNYESVIHRERISKLLQYPFFQVDINLRSAQNLQAKDACGTSDPYVKFKLNNQIVFKSRTVFKSLNPKWDQYFVLPVEDIFEPIMLKVYDHDYFLMDDYLGTTHINLTKIEPGILTELELFLHDTEEPEKNNTDEGLGKIFLTVKLNPKSQEEKELYYGRGKSSVFTVGADGPVKKVKSQPWDSSVNVLLISGENIFVETDYCIKFKLSNEKYKSKVIPKSVRSPIWTEQFDMHLFMGQSQMLEIALCASNQNDSIDKIIVDLANLETDKTHKLVKQFPCSGQKKLQSSLEMLITVTGTAQGSANISSELGNYNSAISNSSSIYSISRKSIHNSICSKTFSEISQKYNIFHCLNNIFDVGHLQVKVYKAENLVSADMNGKSDPFCVLELVNDRLQTSTEYKTLSPEWNKTFSFNVKDIHSVLEVTIYDEDRDRVEFLGKVGIPLLKIKNGEKKWYALKDKKLRNRVKGHILLEFWLTFSKFKASVRTLTPREMKYLQPETKFKPSLFVQNATRLKNLCLELMEIGQFMNSCIQWDSPFRSMLVFIVSLTFIYFFEIYMAPFLLFLILMKNYLGIRIRSYFDPEFREEEIQFIDENVFEEDDDDLKTEEKKSLKERLQTVQETTTLVMNIIGDIASYIERVKNTANFSVPFLSWLAIVCLVITTVILYHIPIRYLIMAWCVNKFTKKFRAPDAINNNEIIDFLSRVPDMEEKIMYKEFKPSISGYLEQSAAKSGSGSIQSNNSSRTCNSPNNRTRLDRSISGDSSYAIGDGKKKNCIKKTK